MARLGSAALFLAANMERMVSKRDLFLFKTTLLAQRQHAAGENYRQVKNANPGQRN